MERVKCRIFKEWITTVIGLVIIIASGASVFLIAEVTWADAAIGISVGCSLFFLKDPRLLKRIREDIQKDEQL